MGATAFATLLKRFYEIAVNRVVAHRGLVDKLVGDEVMAFVLPGSSHEHLGRDVMETALGLMHDLGYGKGREPVLPVGIGVHVGPAWVGRIKTGSYTTVTALGDTVNTAARLQSEAAAGQIVVGEPLFADIPGDVDTLEEKALDIRGREETVAVRIIALS